MSFKDMRIIVLGSGGAGKSALVTMFISNHFIDFYDPTIEDAYRKQVAIDSDIFLLDILDTAGQEEYSAMRDQYMRHGDGFMLVYSIDARDSFEEVVNLRYKIFQANDKDINNSFIPMILIGCKCDLIQERQVMTSEAIELAKSYNIPFLETSAKNNINVEESFFELVRVIVGRFNKSKKCTTKTKLKNAKCIAL